MQIFRDDEKITIGGIIINEIIFQDEMVDFEIRDRLDLISVIKSYMREAGENDFELMLQDVNYLNTVTDEFVFSSISTNHYIPFTDNEDEFKDICNEILDINKTLNNVKIKIGDKVEYQGAYDDDNDLYDEFEENGFVHEVDNIDYESGLVWVFGCSYAIKLDLVTLWEYD